MMKVKLVLYIALIFSLVFGNELISQKINSAVKLARVKYSGGGDWYNDPSAEVNLLKFVNANTNIRVDPTYEFVDISTDNLFQYPLLFLTGHGNVNFTDNESRKLRAYLQNGGFLYIDDDYGLDKFIRTELKKVLPEQELVEIPFNHGIFNIHYKFPKGVPKIHEHDDKVPKTYGLFHNGRLCVVYTVESNPSDGWPDADIHNNPPEKRTAALQFGTNIIVWALTN